MPAVHDATPPANGDILNDGSAPITTGTRFTVDAEEDYEGVDFWVPATNTGTYSIGLWETTSNDNTNSGTGTLLASGTVAAGSLTGGTWGFGLFSGGAVTLQPDKVYTVGRHASSGRYVSTPLTFTSSSMSGNGITLLQAGSDPTPPGLGTIRNGVFTQDPALQYPQVMFNQSDYFVEPRKAAADPPNDAVIAGNLPAVAGSLTGDQVNPAVVAGNAPGIAGSLAGDQLNPIVLAGTMAGVEGSLTADYLVTGQVGGVVFGVAGVLLLDSDEPPSAPVTNWELAMLRKGTTDFINARPTVISLNRRERYRMGTGAWKWRPMGVRDPQTMRVIEQGPPEVFTTQDGVQRRLDYVLLAEWDADVVKGDWFLYDDDAVEVVEVYHDNGYEVRASLVRMMDPPALGV